MIDDVASTLPMKILDTPIVTVEPAHHHKFFDCAPFRKEIDERSAVMIVYEDLNNQNASSSYLPSKVNVCQEVMKIDPKQWTPVVRIAPDRSPETRLLVHIAFLAAEIATEKSATAFDAFTLPASIAPELSK